MYFKKQQKKKVKPKAWRNTATLNLVMQKEMKDMLQILYKQKQTQMTNNGSGIQR
jgi:hypothetical protein